MAIIFDSKRKYNPEVFIKNVRVVAEDGESYIATRFGVKDGDRIIIPPEYNFIEECADYGYVARKDASYCAFSRKGVMFVKDAPGIEPFGMKGVLVYEDTTRENPKIVPWAR